MSANKDDGVGLETSNGKKDDGVGLATSNGKKDDSVGIQASMTVENGRNGVNKLATHLDMLAERESQKAREKRAADTVSDKDGVKKQRKGPAMKRGKSTTQSTQKKPSFSVERSRSQVLCRTGLAGKGQSYPIKYGCKEQCKNEVAAIKMAKQWVQRHAK